MEHLESFAIINDGAFATETTIAPEVTVAPAPAKVTPALLIEQYGCAKTTNRAKMLTCLGRNFGKQVTRAKLLTAVYGSDDLANKGGLAMLLTLIKDRDQPYVIVKKNTTIGLYHR